MPTSSERRNAEAMRILALLPGRVPEDVARGMLQSAMDELGEAEFLVFRRESWDNSFDDEIGWPTEEWTSSKHGRGARWAAACTCGACGSSWHSGWKNASAFYMAQGEDGAVYPGIPDLDDLQVEVGEGERTVCPYCDSSLVAVPISGLKNGRTYHILMGRAENLERYTAVVYWMLERVVNREAKSRYAVMPWAAIVVGEGGDIYRFTHTTSGMYGKRSAGAYWMESRNMGEPIRQRYYAWGAINNTQMGGYYVTDVPDQAGMTAEKTGLADYLAGGGEFPLAYLLRQRKWKALENLVRAGWTYTIDAALCQEIKENTRRGYYLEQIFDLSKVRPRDMLRMRREDAGRGASLRWDFETAMAWKRCEGLELEEFAGMVRKIGVYGLKRIYEEYGAAALRRIVAYLQKQKKLGRDVSVTLYLDYRRMLRETGGGDTELEQYPPNLRAAHDRVMQAKQAAASRASEEKFAAVRETWGALEWSDGRICAMLPSASGDLVAEGRTLRHCVGGYSRDHTSGKLIVFIRHARRPERSWFTLNIDVTGRKWYEVQLHGYGNERAGGKELQIPKEVRAFVDKWEKEVLTPAFRKVKAAEKKAKKNREEGKAA